MRRALLVGSCAVAVAVSWLAPFGGREAVVQHATAQFASAKGGAATPGPVAGDYRAALPVDVPTPTTVYNCTSGYLFRSGPDLLGSTAGHCGSVGDQVTTGDLALGAITFDALEASTGVVTADVALYPLTVPSQPEVAGGADAGAGAAIRTVTGALRDEDVVLGDRLCFNGRASGADVCGAVNARSRTICCDQGGRSFLFTCIDHPALAGDSGAPVYRPVGADGALAAGVLSSSVTIEGTSSTCFSSIDEIEARTSSTLVLG